MSNLIFFFFFFAPRHKRKSKYLQYVCYTSENRRKQRPFGIFVALVRKLFGLTIKHINIYKHLYGHVLSLCLTCKVEPLAAAPFIPKLISG